MENKNEELSLLDVLLDPDNKDPIVLSSDDGEQLTFEQIALIPYEKDLFSVLRPLTEIEGIGSDEVVVFKIVPDDDNLCLAVEEDEDVANAVYEKYIKLVEDAQKKKK